MAAAAAAAAARRLQTTVIGASTAAAQRIRTTVLGSSTAAGSRSHMSKDLLRRLHQKEIRTVFGLPPPTYLRLQQRPLCSSSSSAKDVAAGKTRAVAEALRDVKKGSPTEVLGESASLKDLESRILTLEVVCNNYTRFQWVFLGPICVGLLMSIISAIDTIHGVYTVKERQKNTAEKLSNLERRIEYLEGNIN